MATELNQTQRRALEPRLRAAPALLLFLDFDGTLAPIAEAPEQARLPAGTRDLLRALAARPDVIVCIVSGRSLADVQKRVGVEGIVSCGDHGLEIEGRGLRFRHPVAVRLREALEALNRDVIEGTGGFEGVQVEPKALTTSIHYRRAAPGIRDRLESVVRGLVSGEESDFRVTEGKMVFEIRPRVDWHKGRAVTLVHDRLAVPGGLAVVVGDDRTDEDAFAAVRDSITIRVGPAESTCARFQLADPERVAEWLAWLLRIREGPVAAPPVLG